MMMDGNGYMGWGMGGGSIVMVLLLVLVILGIVALAKYAFFD